jgi:glycosyltransferase involved in cell wall biosynthesis
MLVSVVIPAFNVEEWLPEAIDSVLQQTYQDLEIVVVDDGSTDRTAAVAEESLRRGRFPYRILSQSNQGAAAARNRGWQAAQGPWVQFLDSDDRLHPRKIEIQMECGLDHRVSDVIYSDWERLVWTGGTWSGDGNIRTPTIGSDALADVLSTENFLQLGSQIFKVSVLDCAGGFDSSHEPIEDVGLDVKIAIIDGRFVKAQSNGPIAWYRDRPRSLSKTNRRQFVESCIKNGKLAERYVREHPSCSLKIVEAVVDVYYVGARYFAGRDWKRFEEIVGDIEALCPRFVPKTPTRLKLLSHIAGYRTAERLSVLYRTSKSIGAKLWRAGAAR